MAAVNPYQLLNASVLAPMALYGAMEKRPPEFLRVALLVYAGVTVIREGVNIYRAVTEGQTGAQNPQLGGHCCESCYYGRARL